MTRFSLKNHWHNLYLALNVMLWATVIILMALFARRIFLSTGIILGICSMVSVVSAAVLVKPGKRLAGAIAQLIAWGAAIFATIIFFPSALKYALVLFLPAGLASLVFLAILGGIGLLFERQLSNAMKK